MRNGPLILIIAIFFLIYMAGLIMDTYGISLRNADRFLLTGQFGGLFTGLYLLGSNGSTYKSPIFWPILALIGIGLIGALFKFMHWPWANQLLVGGLGGSFVLYLIAFFLKKRKGQLDIFKLVWVAVATVGTAMAIMHFIVPPGISHLRIALFWLLILNFIVFENRKKTATNGEG